MSSDIHVIVGAGQAGGHAAMAMREAGFAGRILLLGDEAHLPYERPPLSKDVLTAAEEPAVAWFHPEARYGERAIEFMAETRVAELDSVAQRLTLADGRTLPYDRLLLATGARARRLPVPGGDLVLYLRTLDDARLIRTRLPPPGAAAGRHVVCIGAGVIGLELASSVRARGCAVTVLEAADGAMGRSLTPAFARYVESLHRAAGVELRFGASVRAIEPGWVVGDGFLLAAGEVIAGIGIERNVELARDADLALDNGIAVDEFGRSSARNIYAAGDVTAFWQPALHRRLRLESWRHAQNHGIAVGRAMALDSAGREPAPYDDVPWFWTDQHGVNLQVAGLPDAGHETIMRGDFSEPSFAGFHLDGTGRVVAATGVNAPREIRAAMALIKSAAVVDRAMLADPAVPPQKLVAGVRQRAGA